MSGDESGKSQEARAFGRWLHAVTGIPVDWCDERYTTRQADNVLEEAQTTAKRRKRRRDMITTDSDFNPYQPLNVANSPPFFKILPRCPSISPASWGDRTGLCYDPGRWLAREPGQQAQQPGGMSHMRQHVPNAARESITVPPRILDHRMVAGSLKMECVRVLPCKSADGPQCKIAKVSALATVLY